MSTARALLIAPALALLAACGGGGDDPAPAPAPVLIWEAQATAADPATGGRSSRSAVMRPSPAHFIPYPARGRECVDGVWTQTVTGPGELRLQARAESFAVQANGQPVTVFATATAAGVVEIPFRLCGTFDLPVAAGSSAALSVTVQAWSGSDIVGQWSARARWTAEGTRI